MNKIFKKVNKPLQLTEGLYHFFPTLHQTPVATLFIIQHNLLRSLLAYSLHYPSPALT